MSIILFTSLLKPNLALHTVTIRTASTISSLGDNGVRLNNPRKGLGIIGTRQNAAASTVNITTRHLLNGTHTHQSEQKHAAPISSVAIVEISSAGKLKTARDAIISRTPSAAEIPPGKAFRITFDKKLPRTKLWFGSKVSRKDGAPIVSAETSVICIGL